MHHDQIIIKGACEHNLKCIDVTIPRDQLVVITGLSGSVYQNTFIVSNEPLTS
jgi:excinuclease ABC subunit A